MSTLLEAMKRRPRPPTNLADEDCVVLFPSLGHLSADGKHWVIDVHGDVSSAGRLNLGKRVLLKLLQRAMRAPAEEIAGPLFQDRIRRFVAHDRPGRRIVVRVGGELFTLPKKTSHSGHFQATLRIAARQASRWAETAVVGSERYLPTEVYGTQATGQAYLIEPTGLSIISDR
jgi:hypothetical protein